MAKRHYGEVLTNYNPDNKLAKELFGQLKAVQRRLKNAAASFKSRNWQELETDASELIHELEGSMKTSLGQLWLYLAHARYHMKRDDDSIAEAADVRRHADLSAVNETSTYILKLTFLHY